MIQFYVSGEPAPQGSKSRDRHGNMYESSKKVKPWRHAVVLAAKQAMLDGAKPFPAGTPLRVDMTFLFRRPKAVKGRWKSTKPDLDKLFRATGDALTQAGIIDDDARIVASLVQKTYAAVDATPGAVIEIQAVTRA